MPSTVAAVIGIRTDADLPLVCAHRGASAHAQENTVAAARAAVDAGAEWVEFDVRPSGDGRLVVHHDPATRDGAVVAQTPAGELGDDAPTFADFVAACGPLGLDIELKTDQVGIDAARYVELVAGEIDRHVHASSANRIVVTSFDQDVLDLFRAHRRDIATGVLFHDRTASWAIDRAIAHGHGAIAPWFRLVDADLVDAAHRAGLAVATWTVNEPRDVRAAAEAGVDMIIGDDPALIIDVLGAR